MLLYFFGVGMLIQIVQDHRFQCFLEMPLIWMARSASYIFQLCCKDYFSISREMITMEIFVMNLLQYAIFGRVTKGDETLRKLEQLPTRREGIFVMVIFLSFQLIILDAGSLLWLFISLMTNFVSLFLILSLLLC